MSEPADDVLLQSAYSWVRLALTGDSNSSVPTNVQLQLITTDKIAELQQAFPATIDLPTAADQNAFAKAVGYAVAAVYVGSPAGARFAGNVVQTKIGSVTKTRKEISVPEAAAALLAESQKALRRVAALRSAPVKATLFDVVGQAHVRRDF